MKPVHLRLILSVLMSCLILSASRTTVLLADEFPPPIIQPVGPVRIPAEFEPMQAVAVVGQVQSLAEDLSEHVTIIFQYKNESHLESLRVEHANWGLDPNQCLYVQVPDYRIPRDFFPWFMFTGDDEPAFVFNRYCDESDCVSRNTILYGPEQGYPVYRSGLDIAGGDFMTDGQGTAVSLDGVYLQNADILDGPDDRVGDFWGVHTYHFIANAYKQGVDDYFHIDCMAKYLSPDTIMIGRLPETDVRYAQSEATVAYFERQINCYGTPYRVTRVDIPDCEPYLNSLIVNHKVYVPIVDTEADANALAAYQAAMPGYEVVGISKPNPKGDSGTFWEFTWALHCDTMGIPDEQMLYIHHIPLLDRPSTDEGFPIQAKIMAYSGQAFIHRTPVVRWRIQGQTLWSDLPMNPSGDLASHQYQAILPLQPTGTVIQYYLHAEDASGRSENHPYIGSPQAHTFTVKPFGADVSAVSVARGGDIHLFMDAGIDQTQLDYTLNYTLDIPDPNDPASALPAATAYQRFEGTLNGSGQATAELSIPELPSTWVGGFLQLSFTLDQFPETLIDQVEIQFLE